MNSPRDLLVSIQRSQFDQASRLATQSFRLQVATIALGIGLQFIPQGPWSHPLKAIPILCAAGLFALAARGRKHRGVAEGARRATLLVDGLGVRLAESDLRRLAGDSGLAADQFAKWNDPEYFASAEPPGVARAVSMLEESAFWSQHLYGASAQVALRRFLMAAGLSGVCFVVAAGMPNAPSGAILLPLLVNIASTLIWVDLLAGWRAYESAAHAAREVVARLERIRQAGHDRDAFYLAFLDYNSVVENAPLMIDGVFDGHKDRLNELWARRWA
jgi:hypothetical protein